MTRSHPLARRPLSTLSAALVLFGASVGLHGNALQAAELSPVFPLTEPGGPAITEHAPLTTALPGAAGDASALVAGPSAQTDLGEGKASYYGRGLAGHRTASGEAFNPGDLTAAHRSLPFGSRVQVTDTGTGRSVVVRINDRGPFGHDRLIDVSEAAARQLGMIGPGSGHVRLTLLGGSSATAQP